jgi:NitT/TauT family transport system substrate-binding protein
MRHLVYVIAAIFVAAVSFGETAAQERLNLAYISPNAGSSSVLWIAKDAGLFKKHGVDVNLLYIEGTPKALMSLFAGELHVVAGTGPAVVNARMRGADATMVMGFEVFLPYYLIANSSVKGAEDLKGKVGANHSAATSADFAMRLGLKSIGIDPDRDVSLRVVGATNLRMIALQQNQAQFTVISNSEREPADKMGFRVLADLASKRIPYPHSGLITSRKILKDRRDAMLRFGRATIEAIYFFKTQKAPTIAILRKYAKVDPIALEPAYNYMKTAIPDAPYPTVEGMRTFINEMGRTQADILKQDPASFVDASIVKAIEDEGFLKRLGR